MMSYIKKQLNRSFNFLMAVSYCLLLLSCTKEPVNGGGDLPPVPEGYVRTSLNLYVEQDREVPTRATAAEEDAYDKNNVWVLVFDQTAPALTSKLMQVPVKATVSGSAPSQQLHALLRATGEGRKIYVVTGLTAAMNGNLLGVTAAEVEAGSITWNTMNAKLQTSVVPTSGIPIGGANYIPMCTSEIDRTSGATKGTATLTQITASFRRIAAKIDVKCIRDGITPEQMMPLTDFQLTGVTLWNGAKQGYVLPQGVLSADLGGEQKYTTVSTVLNNSVASQIYLYENNKDNAGTDNNPTTLIIQGKYNGASSDSYYRLDLLNTTVPAPGRNPINIERNTQYVLKISKVETVGYTSAQEAYNNGPSNNIRFDLEVTEPTAHDLVSNGQYYLGLSNSEYIVFSSGTKTAVTIAEIVHNAPSTVGPGSVTISNLVGTSPSSISDPFTVRNGTKQNNNLTMTLPAGFISCNAILRLGNLMQTIRIERRSDLLAFGGYIPVGDGYAYGSFPAPVAWAKLSNRATDDLSAGLNDLTCTPGQMVYMILDDNITLEPGTVDRSCEFYLSGGKASGRSKIAVDQPKFDIISQGASGVFQDTYVGTFHRHNQRGERLIRMSSTNTQFWLAQVVVGKDFIRLDDNASPDNGIYTAGFNSAENYLVTGDKIRVTGTGAIQFRVGLTGTIASNQVRYGLITVIHSGGINRIFVRQGEKADYVMRPENSIYDNAGTLINATRPDAREISPYNLTDPSGRLSQRVDLSGNQGGWVQYPSQAGYFFQANTPYAWAPNANAVDFNTSSAVVSGADAVCPGGYRRIRDGANGNAGVILGSEMRQSLWYYPKAGYWSSDYENTIRGLLADGFFDRQTSTEATSHARKTSTVGSGAQKAYIGTLIFNPYNYASIFMPAAGTVSYFLNVGSLFRPGLDAIWWSSTYRDAANGNYWSGTMQYYTTSFTFDNAASGSAMGASVRCVVDPAMP